jgi:hypothetical protein
MRKLCQTCQIEKDLNDFYKYTKRDGTKAYRNMCKVCKNLQDKRRTNNNYISVKKESKGYFDDMKIDNKEMDDLLKKLNEINFDDLLSLIDNSDKILKMIDININYKADAGIKIKKSITISENIHNKILQLSRSSNLNYSNVVDMLLKKALEDG